MCLILLLLAARIVAAIDGGVAGRNLRLCDILEQQPDLKVCHSDPGRRKSNPRFACLSLQALLRLRARIVRKLSFPDLPELIFKSTHLHGIEDFVSLESDLSEDNQLSSKGCSLRLTDTNTFYTQISPGRYNRNFHLFIAAICIGILQEEDTLRHSGYKDIGNVARYTWKSLNNLLQCPWQLVSDSGWPVFGLMARMLRKIATRVHEASRGHVCKYRADYAEIYASAFARGIEFPAMRLRMLAIALPNLAMGGAMNYDTEDDSLADVASALCFWEEIDKLTLPMEPVCVAFEIEKSRQTLLAARDCNPMWPKCANSTGLAGFGYAEKNGRATFRLYVPVKRDIAADTVREEQRPYCTLNNDGILVNEVLVLLDELRAHKLKRSITVVEVGATFGDCTLIIRSLAERAGVGVEVTAFEPNPDSASILEANFRLNDGPSSKLVSKVAIIGNGTADGQVMPLLLSESSVHTMTDGPQVKDKPTFTTSWTYLVPVSSLDREVGNAKLDLLLVSVNGFELEVMRGASRILSTKQVRRIISMTPYWEPFRDMLKSSGYDAELRFQSGMDVWSVGKGKPED